MNPISRILIEEIKMKINKNKTKVLVCTKKEQTRQECIKIDQENLEGVKEFRYLYLGVKSHGMGGAKKKLNQELPKLKWVLIQNKNCYAPPHQLRKQKDAIEDICMDHSHVWMRNLENWRIGEKEIESFRNVVLQKNDEYMDG